MIDTSPVSRPYASAKAYRVPGGAVVTITRDGVERRYRVNCYRFRWLSSVFALAAGGGCWFGRNGFRCDLALPIGEAVEWLRSKHWKA